MQPATVYPWLTYDDAHAAIDFLQTAFGGEAGRIETAGDGSGAHAELRFGNGLVMVGSAGPPRDLGYTREYAARDPEGTVWHFGTYQPLEHR